MRMGKFLSSLTKPELEEIVTNANFTDDEQKIFELLTKDRCILVMNQKGNGYRRLCIDDLRLIEQKVSNSPHWCKKRK